jgi:hypothetical protein
MMGVFERLDRDWMVKLPGGKEGNEKKEGGKGRKRGEEEKEVGEERRRGRKRMVELCKDLKHSHHSSYIQAKTKHYSKKKKERKKETFNEVSHIFTKYITEVVDLNIFLAITISIFTSA